MGQRADLDPNGGLSDAISCTDDVVLGGDARVCIARIAAESEPHHQAAVLPYA